MASCFLFSIPNSTGSTFFPFRVEPFSERSQNNFDRVAYPKANLFPLIYCPFLRTVFLKNVKHGAASSESVHLFLKNRDHVQPSRIERKPKSELH